MKIFILDPSYREWLSNKIFDGLIYKKFIGSEWILSLHSKLIKMGFIFITSDIAIDLIKSKKINATDCFIILEGGGQYLKKLIKLGCHPQLSICQESPIFLPQAYENTLIRNFKYIFRFSGIDDFKSINHLIFPIRVDNYKSANMSYCNSSIAYISTNKYIHNNFLFIPNKITIKSIKSMYWHYRNYLFHPIYRKYLPKLLYIDRINILYKIINRGMDLHIYGSGWADLSEYPLMFLNKLKKISNSYKGYANSKSQTLEMYDFCLIIENTSINGLVTEKIYESLNSGCIPIYYGAKDIDKYVNKDIFINLNKFNTIEEGIEFIYNLTVDEILSIKDKIYKSNKEIYSHNDLSNELVLKLLN